MCIRDRSFTYPPNINVIISNVKEIWFWNSYLPTFLHNVMKYPVFFFWMASLIHYLTFSDSYKWQPLPRNTMHSQHKVFLSMLAGLNIRDSILTNLFTKKFICLINNAVSGGLVSQNRRGSNSKKLQTRLGTLQKRMIDLRSGLIRCRWGKLCNLKEDSIQILPNQSWN